MTLSRIFVPFFTEMLLLNMMGTINTLMLSHYSDDAVAAVGSATQLLGMILTFYTVIGTGASIVINPTWVLKIQKRLLTLLLPPLSCAAH